jgi:uncharacterized membrane protein
MYLLTITDFIAHLHPALVHLPIGILLIALVLQWLSQKEKFLPLRAAVPVVLLAGLISAVLSCITGFLLFRSSNYDGTLVSWHMWMALALTFTCFALFVRSRFGHVFDRTGNLLGLGLFVLIMITGHLGGSLTHGEDYLSSALSGGVPPPAVIPPIADVQQAVVYDSIVRPILQTQCYSCHGPNKQKGGLRLDNPAVIAKGGKDGLVLVAGRGDSSELIKRILLPKGDDHHMPPKDHRQPSRQQQQLLSWWIDQGADFSRRVRDLPQPEKIRPALLALQSGSGGAPEVVNMLPEEPVAAGDGKAIAALKDAGVVVMPLAQNSNYLSVNFFGRWATGLVQSLLPLKKQLVQLDLSNTGVGDSVMSVVAQCKALRYLVLSNTHITDKGLAMLAGLPELRVLNLVGTPVTGEGLLAMQPPKHLHAVYLYRTHVDGKNWGKLVTLFKGAVLDSGGYTLPVLVTDTAVVRPKVR